MSLESYKNDYAKAKRLQEGLERVKGDPEGVITIFLIKTYLNKEGKNPC